MVEREGEGKGRDGQPPDYELATGLCYAYCC